jgi:transcriptional regulator with XRE-family HTH domain
MSMKLVAMDDDGRTIDLPNAEAVPSWIKTKRSEKKLSLQDLGTALGVTKQAVYSWESGISAPTAENLTKLVSLFREAPAPAPKAKKKTASKMDAVDALLMPHARNATAS